MNKFFATLIVCIATVCFSYADNGPVPSESTVENVWSSIGDILIVRPIGTAVTVANFGIFGVASPFAAMADATDEVYGTLVEAPADYTFNRDLGELKK